MKLDEGSRGTLPGEVLEKVEEALRHLVSPLKRRIDALKEKVYQEAEVMELPVPSDQDFFHAFATACNGTVTPLLRKQLKSFHEVEKKKAKELELEALGMFLWPQASGSDIRSDLGQCLKEALGDLSGLVPDDMFAQIGTQQSVHQQAMQG